MKGEEKGITLVALVITIIVLIILAVVAIKLVQESDIIIHAKKSADEYVRAKENETNILENHVTYIDNKKPNKETRKITIVVGDIDGNGKINPLDYSLLSRYVQGTYTSEKFPEIGDLDGDGDVDENDDNYLRAAVMNIIPPEAINYNKTLVIER